MCAADMQDAANSRHHNVSQLGGIIKLCAKMLAPWLRLDYDIARSHIFNAQYHCIILAASLVGSLGRRPSNRRTSLL